MFESSSIFNAGCCALALLSLLIINGTLRVKNENILKNKKTKNKIISLKCLYQSESEV